jgi:hypothetical protein
MTMIGVLCLFLSGIAGFFIIGSLSLFIKESDALGKKHSMTPRRYLASTLTVDNRDLASQAESLTDEAHALRMALREAKARIKALEEDNAALTAQRDELAELVKVRDEQLAELRARGWERL